MSIVSDTLTTYLPAKRKNTPSGWCSFNAPCCIHNGETQDTKQRGGLIENGEGISYHCFNCGFKASWQPGRTLNYKMRKLLRWLNAPDEVINKLSLEVLRISEGVESKQHSLTLPKFETVQFPEGTVEIVEDPCAEGDYQAVLDYMRTRNLQLDDGYRYYWCNNLVYKRRLIVPFYYESRLVGWTARTIDSDRNPRYMLETQPGFVYGLDEQRPNKVFCIVTEGPIDANHVEGVSIMGSEISEQQALLINRLNKDIIVVPDRDSNGKKLAEQAIELGWQVSLPEWNHNCKDISDAVAEYGRLYTLYSVANAAESSPLKIRLRMKKWFI
jgi:hypothetical protein